MGSFESMANVLSAVGAYDIDSGSEVRRELRSYALELDALSEEIEEVLGESVVVTAEDEGLLFYEKLVGRLGNGLSLEDRREMIIYLLTLNSNDNTIGGIEKFFRSLGLECEIYERPHIFDLYIVPLSRDFTVREKRFIINRAKEFLPCHLTFTIDFRTSTWADYDNANLTFAEIDALGKTWNYFEFTEA